jgi:hypothetical protein
VDEGGLRAPCFIRWPEKIQPGTTIREIAGDIDLLPTLTSLAGVPFVAPKPLDGKDLSPLLMGRAADWPERMLFSHQNGRVSVRTPRYRLDDRGALFDLLADPGQTTNVAAQQADLTAKLTQAVTAWREEVLPKGADDRPYPVGFPAFPMTPLPARDGVPHGGIQRSASAPNCSYFVNWTSLDDSMTWDIEVNTAGNYEAVIQYACPEAEAGATIELSFNGRKLAGKVSPGWFPSLLDKQDRVPRKGESYMKEFKPLKLGNIRLEPGRGPLTLRALQIPGKEVMHVRLVTLTLK